MSTRPNRSIVAVTQASASAGSPAFAACHAASPSMVATAASRASAFREEIITRAPLAANSCAIARPMPREPPVISATRPSRRTSILRALEVEAGLAAGTLGGDGVDVALTQDEVLVAADLDLEPGIGGEQHAVAGLEVAHRGAHLHDLGPDQPPVHVGGGRDQDPGA